MKNKTLLIAAAALVAGVVSSEAQVYSANIVGYANTVLVPNGGYSLIATPLDDGNGNQLTNILSSAIANKSQVLTWNGASYNTPITKGGGVWPSSVSLPPGSGYFVKLAGTAAVTNTFVGNVVVATGSSFTNVIGNGYSLVGSGIPYAGDVTTDTNINLGATLANKSQLLGWDPVGQAYLTPVTKGGGVWPSSFNVAVGQGFFVKTTVATNWVETLP